MVASPLLYSRLRLVTPLAQSPEQGKPRCPHNRRAASPPASGHFGLAEDLRTASAAGSPEGINWYRSLLKPSITPFVMAGDNVQPLGSTCQGDPFERPLTVFSTFAEKFLPPLQNFFWQLGTTTLSLAPQPPSAPP